PVGLRDDAHAKALCLEHAADDGHAEARMVHIRVAGDEDDVAAVPPERVHFAAAHRQERRRAEAMRPVLAVAGERLRGAREEGNVDGGVHGRAGPHGTQPCILKFRAFQRFIITWPRISPAGLAAVWRLMYQRPAMRSPACAGVIFISPTRGDAAFAMGT